jgi:DNA polymerase-3 subunit alpha
MSTIASIDGFYYRPRIDSETLLKHSEGLIFSTACVSSFVNANWGIKLLDNLMEKHRGDVYGEVQPHTHPLQYEMNSKILQLKNKYNQFNLIATQDSHYINREDKNAHDVLLTIQSQKVLSDPTRWQFSKGFECYFPTANDMISDFIKQDQLDRKTYLDSIRNTIEVSEKCKNFNITSYPVSLPKVPGLDNVNENDYLKSLCVQGIVQKGFQNNKNYLERMEYELKTIKDKGFSLYFLIIWDLFSWMHKNEILTNCRGSVGNSLVAHLIGITNVDPLEYNLPFSRFINEERNDLPDIDVDVVHDRREDVIQRLRQVYGENNIGNISTFSFLKDKSAIRDVCRVREINTSDVNNFCKEIKKDVPEDSWFEKKYPQVMKDVTAIKGTVRSYGVHAAGIILSNFDLKNGERCSLVYGKENALTVNWDKYDAEYCGLIKFDLLGVKKLTVIRESIKLINLNHNANVHYDKFTYNDPKVFESMSDGDTVGSFQLSGFSTTEVAKQMGIENFKHIIHCVSLSRPGPKDSFMTEDYIQRKHGKIWNKKHELYEDVLKETYGLVVFQDDVMNVIHKVAGLPYHTADKIRSIIGKKRDVSEFKPYRDQFVQGCLKQKTLSEEEANDIWDGFEKHALYSFNKAHATFYAILAYKTMWLKVNYPAEFLCASLSHEGDDIKPSLIYEAQRLGLKIYPPKIGISDPLKWKTKDSNLYCAFNEIKGIGTKTLEKLAATNTGFFTPDDTLIKGKVKKILEDIKAYDVDAPLPMETCNYFDIDICNDYQAKYPKLIELYGDKFNDIPIYNILRGDVDGFEFLKKGEKFKTKWPEVESCKLCELHKECKNKVLPSVSENSIMILGEAPFVDEHREGKPFCGRAGDKLWKELRRYDLRRSDFNVLNTVMCPPLKSKNPKEIHIDACRPFLLEQINFVKPFIILCLGNLAKYALTGILGGITKVNATTEWNEEYGSYISYCMHPSACFRSAENIKLFSEGIEHFSKKLEQLGNF